MQIGKPTCPANLERKCSAFVEWKGEFSPDIIEIKYDVRTCVIAFVTAHEIIIIVLFKNDLHFMCN